MNIGNQSRTETRHKSVRWYHCRTIEIPAEWEAIKGEELFTLSSGVAPSSISFSSDVDADMGYLQIDDMNSPRNGKFVHDTKLKFHSSANPSVPLEESDTLVFPKRGASILTNKVRLIKKTCAIDPNIMALKCKDVLLPAFVYHSLLHLKLHNLMENAGLPQLNNKDLYPRFFVVPPLHEQEGIASILSKVDDLIQKTEEIIEQTQRLKKGLMHRLLTNGIGHTNFKEIQFHNKQLRIPEKWEIIKLEDNASKIGSGVTPLGGSQVYQKEGIPFIRSQNVHFDGLHLEEIAYIPKAIHDEMSSTKLQPHDVLLNITGASIGRCTYVPPDFGQGNVNQHVCIIRPTEKLNPVFLAKFLSTPLMQSLINSKQGGLSRQGLTFKEIGDMSILCPSIEEQLEIGKILSSVDSLIQNEQKKHDLFSRLKEGLMRKLLKGQIRVKA